MNDPLLSSTGASTNQPPSSSYTTPTYATMSSTPHTTTDTPPFDAPSTSSTTPTSATAVQDDIHHTPISTMTITNYLWNSRLQDKGTTIDLIPKKHYKNYKITPIGPEGQNLYYYGLSCIAIDLLKVFYNSKAMGLGWNKLPNNKINVKAKMISKLMALRKKNDSGQFVLDQGFFVSILENGWRASAVDTIPHHNDRVRLFGIIMTLPQFRETYQVLGQGITSRAALDDTALHLPELFQQLAFAFNNEDIQVILPSNAYDLPLIEEIDPNDIGRIRIIRDGMGNYLVYTFIIIPIQTISNKLSIFFYT